MRHPDCRAPLRRKPRLRRRVPDGQQQVRPRQPHRHRFAQRPRRQAAPIAKPLPRIHHDQAQGFLDRRVLKPVIQHDHPRPRRLGRPYTRRAVLRHPDRRESRQQQRLIPHIRRRMFPLLHAHRPLQPPAMPARYDMCRHALRREPLQQRNHRGCLARAPGIQIADADHRHPGAIARRPHPPRRSGRIDRAQGRQHPRRQRRPVRRCEPEPRRAHQPSPSMMRRIIVITRSVTSAPSDATAHAACASRAARSGDSKSPNASARSAADPTARAARAAPSRPKVVP
jgi:hypothetical protein